MHCGEADRADLQPVRRQRVGFHDHPEAQLRRVASELLGDLVELDLLAEARLRRAVAALGPARRLVGEDARGLELVARQLVGYRLQRSGVEGARDAVGAVAAAVDQRLQVHPGELAVLRDAGAEAHQHRMPAAVHVEHFFAVEADLHRAAEDQRRLADHHLVVAHVALAAEAAAVRRRDDAHMRGRNLQHAGKAAVHVVRHLRRRPERELAFAVERRDRGVLLDRQMRVALVEEEILEDVVGASRTPLRRRRTRTPAAGGCCRARRSRGWRGSGVASASSGEAMVASGLYLTSISSSASAAVCSSFATTAATGSPT